MTNIIYVDILICINMFINYFMLLATANFLRLPVKRLRFLLGSLLGAFYSLYILLPPTNIFVSFIIKLFMSITIVIAAFGALGKKYVIKSILCFYLINFAFSGSMMALWYLFSPKGLVVKNSVVYFNISPLLLFCTTLVSYVIIQGVNKIIGTRLHKSLFCDVVIYFNNSNVKLRAKIDTGNTLKEPFSDLPAIVTEFKYIKKIIPRDMHKFFIDLDCRSFPSDPEKNKYRVVPFQVISEQGVLPAFLSDRVMIIYEGITSERKAYIAVCCKKLLTGNFCALLNPELLNFKEGLEKVNLKILK